jgi:hypothetical protein
MRPCASLLEGHSTVLTDLLFAATVESSAIPCSPAILPENGNRALTRHALDGDEKATGYS